LSICSSSGTKGREKKRRRKALKVFAGSYGIRSRLLRDSQDFEHLQQQWDERGASESKRKR